MTDQHESCLFVINPSAGAGKALRSWNKLHTYLQNKGIQHHSWISTSAEDLHTYVAQAAVQGQRQIFGMGGDGTIHLILNACLSTGIPLHEFEFAQIPVGTGNDWLKSYGRYAADPVLFYEGLAGGDVKQQMVCRLEFGGTTRFSMNMTGLGFSGKVVETVQRNTLIKKTGAAGYVLSLILSLFAYRDRAVRIVINGFEVRTVLFHLSMGIGKFAGGGMKFCPQADPASRDLELSIVSRINRWKVVRHVLDLFNGSYQKLSEVEVKKGNTISIEAEIPLPLECDGEYLGRFDGLDIEVLPERMNVRVPRANQ
jgi:YegS/Rv2252/BmrU family lipid kinase